MRIIARGAALRNPNTRKHCFGPLAMQVNSDRKKLFALHPSVRALPGPTPRNRISPPVFALSALAFQKHHNFAMRCAWKEIEPVHGCYAKAPSLKHTQVTIQGLRITGGIKDMIKAGCIYPLA